MIKKDSVTRKTIFVLFLLVGGLFGLWWFYFAKSINEIVPPSKSSNTTRYSSRNQVEVFPVAYAGYLVNSGMGWQADESPFSSYFPETVLYANRSDISWVKLNPLENIYNWNLLDEQISYLKAEGKQFSFRVFTMSGESYGGHQFPQWVLDKGAVILSSGEPDYSNCVYQEQWGRFVDTLLKRYDGNPEIAFIDISGYGNFNEWSWQDQTQWDSLWETRYRQQTADSSTLQDLDSQARRRLVDMFIGGSYKSHQCKGVDGNIQLVNYNYDGAKKTQLVMPYGGIVQSTQYVFIKRKDVGFRFDCLGRNDLLPLAEISQIWHTAPVIYEFCGPNSFNFDTARTLLENTHPIIVHNNDYHGNLNQLNRLIIPLGYHFFLKKAVVNTLLRTGENLSVSMFWQNLGTSPVYLKMGQDPKLHLYLADQSTGQIALSSSVNVDFSTWQPADPFLSSNLQTYRVDAFIPIPASLLAGYYVLSLAIVDARTGLPVQLAMKGASASGQFVLFTIQIR